MPAAETSASFLVASASAAGTYLLAEAGQAPVVSWSWLMPVISAGISLFTTIVVLKVKTDHLETTADRFRQEMREDLREITGLIRDTSERVARLEGPR